MSKKIFFIFLFVTLVTAFGSYVFLQSQRITEQEETIQKQQASMNTLSVINVTQNATIKALTLEKQQNDTILVDNAQQIDSLERHITDLDKKLQEGLNDSPILTMDAVLPFDVSNAFCLQWQTASGVYTRPSNITTNATQSASTRKIYTNATGYNATATCSEWKKMTVRDAVEWNSQLLRHAGREREDKLALRKWAEQGE